MLTKFLNFCFRLSKTFFAITGFISVILVITILFFGDTSHIRRSVIFENFIQMMGFEEKYNHFVANTPEKIFKVFYIGTINKFKKKKIPNVEIIINFKNLKILEAQRKRIVDNDIPLYANARIKITENENKESELIKVKIRAKGDREMHRLDMDQMSYKVDVRNDNFIFGMEEMSIQKPITRNFGWELLFHEIIKKEGLIHLKVLPINLLRNSKKLGLFVIEEGFSKELLERQGRKDGPIVGIEENLNQIFPMLTYDFYSENKWISNYPDIYITSRENLELLKKSSTNRQYEISNYFDIDMWAKFFAIADVLKGYHAAVPKSVKLYYNPSNGLFEPIAFDAHIGSGYEEFIFLDFFENNNINCGYVCEDKDWLKVFFNEKNYEFIKLYLGYLEKYTSKEYLDIINDIVEKKIEPFNELVYSEYSNFDRVFFKGFLPYYFDLEPIIKRAKLIRIKLNSFKNFALLKKDINNLDFIQRKIEKKEFKSLDDLGDVEKLDKIIFSKGLWILKDFKIIDKTILLEDGAILYLKGENHFQGSEKKILIQGNGMIVQLEGILDLQNIKFKNLKNIKIDGLNWTGSINAINSSVKINDVEIISSKGEDAINLVNSQSFINNLEILDSESDGIDVDFGNLLFTKISCIKAFNDCLDTSGATIKGDHLYGVEIGDKLASFGEQSNVNLKNINGSNINIGVVSKDASFVEIDNLEISNAKIYAAAYIKKFFFGPAELKINSFKNFSKIELDKKAVINAEDNILIVNQKNIQSNINSNEIGNLLN